MASDVLAIAVMVLLERHLPFMVSPQRTLPVLSNPSNACSSLSQPDLVMVYMKEMQHPESGRLWEEHINKILKSPELGFTTTTHDRCIYSATIDGEKVLLLRQVDDFALACPNEQLAKKIYDIIGKKLQLQHESKPPFDYFGLLRAYNGVTITQSREHITVDCASYIDRVLRTHGWENEIFNEQTRGKQIPMDPSCLSHLYKEVGHPEGTVEHARLAQKQGFSYRTLLGELLYAYIVCRPDIGYAVTTL